MHSKTAAEAIRPVTDLLAYHLMNAIALLGYLQVEKYLLFLVNRRRSFPKKYIIRPPNTTITKVTALLTIIGVINPADSVHPVKNFESPYAQRFLKMVMLVSTSPEIGS